MALGLLHCRRAQGCPAASLGSRKQPKLACDSFSAAVALLRHTCSIRSCSALLSPALLLAVPCKHVAVRIGSGHESLMQGWQLTKWASEAPKSPFKL